MASEVVEDASTLRIKTPSLIQRQTLKLRLDNGLEAYLISDPGVTEAAAALACEVGSWQNPPDRPGLAHFVEHLLFLGNSTYPEEGEFRQFIEEHGGTTNAYTSDHYTAFMFSVQDGALEGALDRFSHFFIDPLFKEEAMRREQKAVDEEFQRTIENDDRRQLMVLKAVGNQEHPSSYFGAGNALTLGTTTHDEARAWFDSHYSANLMHLVVLSSRPLEELRILVDRAFEVIPNRGVGPFVTHGSQFSEQSRNQILYINPHEQIRQLSLIWELPYDHASDIETQAVDLVSFVLGHEGEGSLLAQLKQEGLAEGLSSGLIRQRKPHAESYLFMLDIDLTESGLNRTEEVADRGFQAIAQLQASGLPQYLQEEMATSRRLAYEYQSRQQPFAAVSTLIDGLVQEDLSTFPDRTLLPTRFNASAIQQVLQGLNPSDCRLMVTAPPAKTGVRMTEQEKWLGASYALQPSPLSSWTPSATDSALHVPPPNAFMPNDPRVYYRGDPRQILPVPQLMASDNYGIYFLARDELYLVPEIAWRLRILSQAVKPGDPRDAVLTDLMTYSIRERLAKIAYSADLARLSFDLQPRADGVALSLDGMNEKAIVLFQHVIEAFSDGIPTAEEFERYKDALKKSYENASRKEPVVQALASMHHILCDDDISPADKIKAIRQVDYEQLRLFFDAFRDASYVKAVLFGNMDAPEAKRIQEIVHRNLQRQPFLVAEHKLPQIITLPEQKGPFYVVKQVKSQGNAVVLAVDQGAFTFKKRGAQQILATGIEAPFFDELRTKQQTGYLAHSWAEDLERHLFSFFAVQSNRYDGQELLNRFELFIEQFLRELNDTTFTLERFETIRRSLIRQLQEPPKNPVEMGNLLARLAFDHDGEFDWLNRRVRGLQALSYDEFVDQAREMLGRANKQRLAVLAEGRLTSDEPLKYRRIRSANQVRQMGSYQPRTEIVSANS